MVKAARSAIDGLSAAEHAFMIPLQRVTRPLDGFFNVLGAAVNGEGMLATFACLYWCWDQHKCISGIWLVPMQEVANGIAKWITRRGRPGWVEPRIRIAAWSSEFSFPSSHTQLVTSVAYYMVFASAHSQAVSVTPALLPFAFAAVVGFSRVSVGLHYPSDVLLGGAWGAACSELWIALVPTLLDRYDLLRGGGWATPAGAALSTPARLGLLFLPMVCTALALAAGYRHVRKSAGLDPPEWNKRACSGKYAARTLDPRGVPLGNYTGMCGVLAGLAVGSLFMKPAWSPADPQYYMQPLQYPASTRDSVLRAIFGNFFMVVGFEGIAAITPRKPLAVYSVLRFIKYMFVPVYILLIAPPAFQYFGV